jgi:hypothetical protein
MSNRIRPYHPNPRADSAHDEPPHQELLYAIEAFLVHHDMSATAFGSLSLNDPAFVQRLRGGREPRFAVREKVWKFMREYRG